MTTLDPPAPGASILDLYRAAWNALRQAIVRYRLAITLELCVIALWVVLRTLVDVESGAYVAWVAVACAVAFISPTSGLVILVATTPFYEPGEVSRALGLRHLLVAALGVSVVLRLVVGGWRSVTWTPAVGLAIAVGAATALGVANTWRIFPADWAMHATHTWLASIGGAMIILIVGVWVARSGETRPLIAAAIACAVASVLSIIELVQPGLISHGVLSWIGFWKDFGARISGIIPAPNAVAAMLVVPATAALGAIAHFHGRRRLASAIVAVLLVAAAILTLSRSAIVALYAAGAVFGWRRRRAIGILMLGFGVVLAVVGVPMFVQFRAGVLGSVAPQGALELILGADQNRINAWASAIRMWLAEPIIGHGFLSYKQLGDHFGDTRLASPHNEILRLFAEEGLVGGLLGLAFVGFLIRELARRPGWIGAGLLAGAIAYWIAAMFNNPLLHIQVSAIVFVFFGYGLAASYKGKTIDAPSAGREASVAARQEVP